jgi:energy-converting hydrogenase Eha subunit B
MILQMFLLLCRKPKGLAKAIMLKVKPRGGDPKGGSPQGPIVPTYAQSASDVQTIGDHF